MRQMPRGDLRQLVLVFSSLHKQTVASSPQKAQENTTVKWMETLYFLCLLVLFVAILPISSPLTQAAKTVRHVSGVLSSESLSVKDALVVCKSLIVG